MKLVDILARELKEWPEGAVIAVQDGDRVCKFSEVEDADHQYDCWLRAGNMNFKSIRLTSLAEDYSTAIVTRAQWQAAVEALRNPLPPLKNPLPMPNVVPPKQEVVDWSKAPEDCVGCLVELRGSGRIFPSEVEQNNSKTIQFRGKEFAGECLVGEWKFYPRPAVLPWGGQSLPPINTICEQHPKMGVDGRLWRQVKVIAHVSDFRGLPPVAVFMPLEGTPAVGQGIAESFRVFKSEEEIAAEERETEIAAMTEIISDAHGDRNTAIALHDAGYRKQVQP